MAADPKDLWPELPIRLCLAPPGGRVGNRQGKQGPERVSNFPKLIQQERNRTRMRTQQPVNQTLSTPAHRWLKVTARSQLSQDVVRVPREEARPMASQILPLSDHSPTPTPLQWPASERKQNFLSTYLACLLASSRTPCTLSVTPS